MIAAALLLTSMVQKDGGDRQNLTLTLSIPKTQIRPLERIRLRIGLKNSGLDLQEVVPVDRFTLHLKALGGADGTAENVVHAGPIQLHRVKLPPGFFIGKEDASWEITVHGRYLVWAEAETSVSNGKGSPVNVVFKSNVVAVRVR